MLNIQFMTEEQATINPHGDKVYIPDYEILKANACCEEERKAIDECKELMERFHDGFAFKIVYTHYGKRYKQDLHSRDLKGEWVYEWTVYQHPWYRTTKYENGEIVEKYFSKEKMIEAIAVQEAKHCGMI